MWIKFLNGESISYCFLRRSPLRSTVSCISGRFSELKPKPFMRSSVSSNYYFSIFIRFLEMTLLPLIVIRLGSLDPVSKFLAAEINQQLRTHFSYRHYLVMSEYEACKSGCITRHTSSVNFVTGYCFFFYGEGFTINGSSYNIFRPSSVCFFCGYYFFNG